MHTVLPFYFCKTNYHKLSSLRQYKFVISISTAQESRAGLHQAKIKAGLQVWLSACWAPEKSSQLTGCWQNPLPCSWRTEGPSSSSPSPRNHCQLRKATRGSLLADPPLNDISTLKHRGGQKHTGSFWRPRSLIPEPFEDHTQLGQARPG